MSLVCSIINSGFAESLICGRLGGCQTPGTCSLCKSSCVGHERHFCKVTSPPALVSTMQSHAHLHKAMKNEPIVSVQMEFIQWMTSVCHFPLQPVWQWLKEQNMSLNFACCDLSVEIQHLRQIQEKTTKNVINLIFCLSPLFNMHAFVLS